MKAYLVASAIGCACAAYPVVRTYIPNAIPIYGRIVPPAYDDPTKFGGETNWGIDHAVNPMNSGPQYVLVPAPAPAFHPAVYRPRPRREYIERRTIERRVVIMKAKPKQVHAAEKQ
jgi:hypothetical protein